MIKLYTNGAFHDLEGQKLYVNGEWKTLKANDRAFLQGMWRLVGEDEVAQAYLHGTGLNGNYNLGLNDKVNRLTYTLINDVLDLKELKAGGAFSMAIATDGTLWGWGSNSSGQQGRTGYEFKVPAQIGTASNWVTLSCGKDHSAVINSLGELYTTGKNNAGQLGLGDNSNRYELVRVGTASNWTHVECGDDNTFAINALGELYGTGDNNYYKLGLGDDLSRNVFTRVGTASNWVKTAAGNRGTLALNTSGELWGAGDTWYGFLADGGGFYFTLCSTRTDWVDMDLGHSHSVVLDSAGKIYTAGNASQGRLGRVVAGSDDRVWVEIGTDFKEICCLQKGVVALKTNGDLYGCGYNPFGDLGLGHTNQVDLLTQTVGKFKTVGTGFEHTIALKY